MSQSGHQNTISRTYDNCVPQQKQALKKALSSMTELDADYANSLAKIMEVLGCSQVDNMKRTNTQLRTNLDAWENELVNSTHQYRDKMAMLLKDLKYITSPIQADPVLSRKLNEACASMDSNGSSDISNRFSPQQLDGIIADKLSVLYPTYRRQAQAPMTTYSPLVTPVQNGQTTPRSQTPPIVSRSTYEPPQQQQSKAYRIDENGNKVYMDISNISQAQDRSPRASEVRRTTVQAPPPLSPSTTKYYYIDPVTGEKVERKGNLSPTTTYANQPTTTYTQPAPTTTYIQQAPLDSETIKMVSDAKKDFGTPTVEIVQVSGNPTKIDVAKDGLHAIYGAENISLLRKRDGWVVDDGVLFDNKTCTIKHLQNGDVLVNNFDNWDLVLLDQYMNEKGKLNGSYKGEPYNYKHVNTRNSEDDSNLLWLSHPDNLSIVRTSNLSSNEIKNFWKFNGVRSNPVACAIAPSGKRLVGISNCNGTFVLHYYDGTDQVVMYRQDDIHPRCDHWECLEIGYDQNMFLLGGRDSKDVAMVLALTLDDDCNLITEKTLPNLRNVTTLRRHNQGDVFFAGGHKALSILFYHKRQLHVLHDIALGVDGFVRDLSFHHPTQELYGVNGTDKAFVLDFTSQSNRPYKSNIRPAGETRARKRLGANMSRSPSQSQLHNQPDTRIINASYTDPDQTTRRNPVHTTAFNDYGIKQLTLPDCKL